MKRARLLLLCFTLAAAAGFAAACDGGDDPDPPPVGPPALPSTCFVGDKSQPPVIEPIFRDYNGEVQPLVDGGDVQLILPPQGGKVMFIGVRAENLDGCPLTIATSLRDLTNDSIVTLERRPVRMEETDDGVLLPRQPSAITNYSNLPGCPRAALARDMNDQQYELTISIEDQDERKAGAVLMVTPRCPPDDHYNQCMCECSADYVLGQDCSGG